MGGGYGNIHGQIETPDRSPPSAVRTAGLYLLIAAASAVAFWFITRSGAHLTAGYPALPEGARAAAHPAPSSNLMHLLVALAVIVATARVVGYLFARYLNQPRVIGEVLAGLLLGPSALGRFAPAVSDLLLPGDVVPFLSVLAQLGVILFMFLVGLDLDTSLLRTRTRAAVAISHTSIVVPFLLGAALALVLYPRLATADVAFMDFALFLGVSLSVTAFPVLARIVKDTNLQGTTVGTLALSAAAVDDVTAWCLLAFVTGFAGESNQVAGAARTVVLAGAFAAAVLTAGPRIARRFAARTNAQAWIVLAILLSSLATEAIGIHALFGAFLVGVVIPHDSALADPIRRRVEDVSVVLLPVFFAFTGLKTRLQLLDNWSAWVLCGVVLAAACIGKVGGSAVAARLTGLGWRDAARIGVLMNTRGLVELVVLTLGLDLGIISPTLFAMLVIMALVTTVGTTPALQLLRGPVSLFPTGR